MSNTKSHKMQTLTDSITDTKPLNCNHASIIKLYDLLESCNLPLMWTSNICFQFIFFTFSTLEKQLKQEAIFHIQFV